MAFSSLVGQAELKTRLGSIVMSEPRHAYVLTGPDGIGKSSFAQAFAQALLCRDPGIDGACGQCDACRHVDHQVHPDLKVLQLEGKDKIIKVERVRQTIQADLALRPQLGRRKIYLIDADFLNEQGQNTLLKSLEEPPDFVTFILMVAGPERLLPTVLSRLTVLPVLRYTSAEVVQIIQRQMDRQPAEPVSPKLLDFYARYANGVPGAALHWLTSPWFASLRRETVEFYGQLGKMSRADVLTSGYAFFETNRAQADTLIDLLASLVRDQIVYGLTRQTRHLTHVDQTALLAAGEPGQMALRIPRLYRSYAALTSARRGLALNASFEGLACNLLLSLRKELSHA
jgi:DNA polymerase-3 subunit delta'